MKFLKIPFLSLVLFITSFFEVAVTKNNLTNFYQVTLHIPIANASSYTCPAEYDDTSPECRSLKAMYNGCNPEGSEDLHYSCNREANLQASNMQVASSEEDFDDTYGVVEADNIKASSFLGVMISLGAEIISAGIRRFVVGSLTVSAWIHLGVAAVLFTALGIMGLIKSGEIEDLIKTRAEKYGEENKSQLAFIKGAATDLSAIKSNDEEFVNIQSAMLDDNIEIFEAMATQNNHYAIATGIGSAGMLTAMGFAIAEIFECGASFGAKGCVYNTPQEEEKIKLYTYLLPSLLAIFISPSTAEEDDTESTKLKGESWFSNVISGLVSFIGGWGAPELVKEGANKGIQKAAEEEMKRKAAESASKKLQEEAGKKATSKIAPIMRAISFALSAANLAWTTHLFNKVANTYTARATALETLKGELLATHSETSVESNAGDTSITTQDLRGLDTTYGESEDFSIGNCADGNLNVDAPKADPGCKTSQTATFGLPSGTISNMPSFGGKSLPTDSSTIGRAVADYANGKGLENSFKSTNLGNSAIRNKTAKKLLKKVKDLAEQLTGNPNAFAQMVKEENKNRAALANAISSSIPKSLFDQIQDPLKGIEEKESAPKNQFAAPTKQEEFDFEMPSMPQQGFEEFGEDGVHDGELAAVNDDFADLASNADDIVKKDGVSIFKVIETRYKKSAYPRFFKRKVKKPIQENKK